MSGKALPATNLASSFAPPASRAAGLRLPPRKAAQGTPAAPQRPVSPVPDPTPAEELEGAQGADSAETQEKAPAAPKARPAKKASKRPSTKAQEPAKAPAQAQPSTPAEPSAVPEVAAPPVAKKAPAPRARAAARESSEPGRLVLWTTVSIRSRMKALQAATDRVYRDQVLDALEATHQQLPDLVAKTSTAPTTTVRGALFERVEAVTAADDKGDERKQLTIRHFLESQLDVIDHLVKTTGAKSRSALVNAALDAYLPER